MTTKITIRFNDGKAADKRALTYLQTVGISYSKAVIKAINAYRHIYVLKYDIAFISIC